jgi:hypothetical protein
MVPPVSTPDLVLELMNSKSAQRRSAAKALRKRQDSATGAALLEALDRELRDPRTWETQYQMIMALGECGVTAAIPLLQTIASTPREATIVFVATGDALIRLSALEEQADLIWHILLQQRNDDVVSGALRGTQMANIPLRDDTITAIVTVLQDYESDHPIMFWAATAAWRWKLPPAQVLLKTLATSAREDIRDAARLSQQGKSAKHNVL